MLLNDYTPLFQVEKKLRRIDNITIPEVSYRAAGWGGAAGTLATVLWLALLGPVSGLLPLPGLLRLLLPVLFVAGTAVLVGKAATSQMRYGKELSQLAASWARFLRTPRRQVDFAPWRHPEAPAAVHVEAVVDARR
jgi:hypothetical protein